MGLITTIFIGFVVGLVARAITPGRDPMGIIMTTLLGVCGAMLGKYIGVFVGHYQEDQRAGFLMSLLGAVILLFIHNRLFKKDEAPPAP